MIQDLKKFIKPAYIVLRHLYYRLQLTVHGIKIKEFDDGFFDNQKIIVIGPAESSLSYMDGKEIDSFDIVVRVNKSHLTLAENSEKLGSRTDVLFHCFHPDPIGGCGYIDEDKLNRQNNKVVIYPYYEYSEMFRFYKFLLQFTRTNFALLNKKYYLEIKKTYPAKIPTTGYQVLNYLIKQNFRELHITGFTFLKTPYINGYRDSHKSPEKIMDLVVKEKNHDPEAEFEFFCDSLIINKHKNIHIDEALTEIIKKYREDVYSTILATKQ